VSVKSAPPQSFPKAFCDSYRLDIPQRVDRSRIGPKDGRYVYHDLEFTLSRDEIVGLLMTEKLYRTPSLAIRELVQNALDALPGTQSSLHGHRAWRSAAPMRDILAQRAVESAFRNSSGRLIGGDVSRGGFGLAPINRRVSVGASATRPEWAHLARRVGFHGRPASVELLSVPRSLPIIAPNGDLCLRSIGLTRAFLAGGLPKPGRRKERRKTKWPSFWRPAAPRISPLKAASGPRRQIRL
jgi:hypothetical protein